MSNPTKEHFKKLNRMYGDDIRGAGYRSELTFKMRKKIIEYMLSEIKTPIFSFLDAGCGNGMFYEAVIRPSLKELERADGIDFVEEAAEQAKKYMDDVRIGNILEMGRQFEKRYDLVNSLEVFQYIAPDKRRLFFKVHFERINRGGYFLLTVPNLASFYRKIFKLRPEHFPYTCTAEDVLAASESFNAYLLRYCGIDIFQRIFQINGYFKNYIAFELSFLFQKSNAFNSSSETSL